MNNDNCTNLHNISEWIPGIEKTMSRFCDRIIRSYTNIERTWSHAKSWSNQFIWTNVWTWRTNASESPEIGNQITTKKGFLSHLSIILFIALLVLVSHSYSLDGEFFHFFYSPFSFSLLFLLSPSLLHILIFLRVSLSLLSQSDTERILSRSFFQFHSFFLSRSHSSTCKPKTMQRTTVFLENFSLCMVFRLKLVKTENEREERKTRKKESDKKSEPKRRTNEWERMREKKIEPIQSISRNYAIHERTKYIQCNVNFIVYRLFFRSL